MSRPSSQPPLRWLLRLYPRSYRERYGEEIAAFVEQERRATGGGVGFWVRLTWDHAIAARRVWARDRGAGRGETMGQDLRWAVRSLRRSRGFTLFAVLTLGLGVGATASVYTVLDRVVLRPFPWDGRDRLVQVGTYIMRRDEIGVLSQPLLRDYLDGLEGVDAVVGSSTGRAVLTGIGDPEQISALEVSRGYLDFFEGQPRTGRILSAEDHAADAPLVAVLSEAFWVERFGADPAAVGQTIELDGSRHEVIGVLASDFTAPQPDFWNGQDIIVPMGLHRAELDAGSFGVRSAARLSPGTGTEELTAALTRIGRERYEDADGFVSGFGARPLEEMVIGTDIRRSLGRVLAAVALLLLIGCLNVASLLLTRATQRATEMRVRASLGATRARLMVQLIAESLVLALAGGVVGGGVAWTGVEYFRRNAPQGIPRIAEVAVDARVLAATLALSLLTVGLFGLLPAWTTSRSATLRPSMQRHGSSRREGRVRAGLVLLETGLAVVLVVWSALLSRDLVAMATEDPGFRSEGLVAGQINLRGRPDGATPEQRQAFLRRLTETAQAIPGVQHVAFATELPYSGNGLASFMTPEGLESELEGAMIPIAAVDGDYFEAFGIRVIEGRLFDTEWDDALQYAVVNDAFVRQYWSDGNPVGRMIKSGGPDVDDEGSYEVIGVVADVRTGPGQVVEPKMYVDYAWEPFARFYVVLQTDGQGEAAVRGLRAALAEIDPGLPLADVVTLEAVESGALGQPAFYATIFSSFGIAALLLALIGVYGTTAYATANRSREIGIRVALGEERAQIVQAILRRTALVVGSGIFLGSLVALAAGRIAGDALRLVGSDDPLTYAGVAVLVLFAALGAAWMPAARLTRVDPAHTLREEAT